MTSPMGGSRAGLDRRPLPPGHDVSYEPLQKRDNRAMARFPSPLPDSNRRPLPYHGSQGWDERARAGEEGQEAPAQLRLF
jgi:hypothetical protein